MTSRPRLPVHFGMEVTGPVTGIAGQDPVPTPPRIGIVPAVATDERDDPASLVADAVARAALLSCLAWGEGAMLPLRLAALAWRQSTPRVTGPSIHQPTRERPTRP